MSCLSFLPSLSPFGVWSRRAFSSSFVYFLRVRFVSDMSDFGVLFSLLL